jgi:hypothetical protein
MRYDRMLVSCGGSGTMCEEAVVSSIYLEKSGEHFVKILGL